MDPTDTNSADAVSAEHSKELQIDDQNYRKMSASVPNMNQVAVEAKAATAYQHEMTLAEGIRKYPKAIAFSMILSFALVMEGYDIALIGNFYAQTPFQMKYGVLTSPGKYQVTAPWQAGLSNGAQVGEIFGLFVAGWISERFGYRKTMIGGLTLMICFIFILFFAPNIQTLLVGQILCGIPWGAFQTLTTTYAAEVVPVALRAYLTTFVNMCWVIGQFIAAGVLRGLAKNDSEWAYRIPFAIQWIFPLPIIVGVLLAPESPWWLVRKGRLDEAKVALLSLVSLKAAPEYDVNAAVSMMVHTNALEIQASEGTSYWDCFKGTDLRRTEITCVTWMVQVWCGPFLLGFAVYFFQQAGLSDTNAFNMNLGMTAIGLVGTFVSWYFMTKFGRRTIYLWGQIGMFAVLTTMGFLAVPTYSSITSWITAALLIVYIFLFDISVAPVCYSLVAEMPSTRLRILTVALARNVYNLNTIIVNVFIPDMLNPSYWDLKGKTCFLFAGTTFLCIIWTYFRLPEPKGLAFAEIDLLFEKKVSARNFRKVQLDLFGSDHERELVSVDSEEKDLPTNVEKVR